MKSTKNKKRIKEPTKNLSFSFSFDELEFTRGRFNIFVVKGNELAVHYDVVRSNQVGLRERQREDRVYCNKTGSDAFLPCQN